MSIISYNNRPAPLAWDVAAAIFGASGLGGGLYDPSDLSTLFQSSVGVVPALPGDPVGLVLDKSGNTINLSQPTAAARPTLARMPKTGRRNLMSISEPTVATVSLGGSSGIVDAAGFGQFSHSINFQKSSDLVYAYIKPNSVSGTVVTISVFVVMDDGLPPVFGASAGASPTNDFVLYVGIDVADPLTYVVVPMGGGIYKVSATAPLGANINGTGVVKRPTNSARGFRATGYQVEVGSTPTPYQRVYNPYDVTEEGVPDTYSLVYDLVDDALTTTFPSTITGDILIAGTDGTIIEPFSGSTLTIGPDTYTGGTPGILTAVGDIVGVVLIDRELTQPERDQLIKYYQAKGAGGLL